jgi:hypothetical protein
MLNPRLYIALLFGLTFFLFTGCEKEESAADRRISENIDASREVYYKKDGGPEKSHKLLESAAKESAASAVSRASAKELVGQSNYALAISRLPEVNNAENDSLRIIREINRIGSELGDEVFLIESLKGSNPSGSASDPLKALSANKAKFAAQVAEFDKILQQLEAKRQELSTKINNLDTEQKSKVEMSNALMQKSDQAKGQESVDLFKQSADVRQAAALLARDLEFARVDLKRTEQLIADTQAERKAAEESIATAQNQITQLNQGWSATEEAIKKRRAEAANLLSRGEVDASLKKGINAESGIEGLAKQFAAAKQRAAEARKSIDETNLEPSIAAYDEADKAGGRVVAQVQASLRDEKDTPVRAAWQRMEKLAKPITYRLGKARSLQLRGQLFLREFNLLQAQQSLVAALQPLFQRAGLNLPQEIAPADLAAQLKTAHDNALRDLSDSAALLKDILEMDDVQRNTWPQANEARALSVAVEYALHHLDRDKGHLDAAKGTVKLLSDNGATYPALPPDLETRTINPVPIVGATTAPTTNPAGGGETPAITPEGVNALKNLLNRARGGAAQPQGGANPPQPAPPPQPNQ